MLRRLVKTAKSLTWKRESDIWGGRGVGGLDFPKGIEEIHKRK